MEDILPFQRGWLVADWRRDAFEEPSALTLPNCCGVAYVVRRVAECPWPDDESDEVVEMVDAVDGGEYVTLKPLLFSVWTPVVERTRPMTVRLLGELVGETC